MGAPPVPTITDMLLSLSLSDLFFPAGLPSLFLVNTFYLYKHLRRRSRSSGQHDLLGFHTEC